VQDLLLPLAALPHSPGAYIALVAVGFLVGTFGHLFKVRWLVGIGIALIVLGALLLPFAAGIPSDEKSPPGEESVGGGFGGE
jgi:cytosine/uracil/thiamine/allantoin permease